MTYDDLKRQYCFNLICPDQYHTAVPNFVHREEVNKYTGFTSVYSVTEITAKAIQQARTTRGFKGVVWSSELYLDFDSYEAGQRAEEKIKELGYEYTVWNTGGRGMHFAISRLITPSHIVPALDKGFVQEYFPEADKCIYAPLHLFRLPGTKHSKTGNIKQKLRSCVGTSIDIRGYVLSESSPQEASSFQSKESLSIFNCFRFMREACAIPEGGSRHAALVRACYALRDDACVGQSAAVFLLGEINKLFDNNKSDSEIEYLVKSIYES